MAAKVLMPFVDLETGKEYLPGSVYDGSDERAAELAGHGLVEPAAKEPAPAKKPQPRRKPAAKE